MTTPRDAPGFFGKVPNHGDFVARRLPADLIAPWDTWLQAGMTDSRARLGDAWLQIYLNSPIWRFALACGVCGPQAWAGVMMPSVDRVGRYFPFTIAGRVGGAGQAVIGGGAPSPAWYASMEALVWSALGEGFSLQDFDAALCSLEPACATEPDGRPAGPAMLWTGDDAAPDQPGRVLRADRLTASLFTGMLHPAAMDIADLYNVL